MARPLLSITLLLLVSSALAVNYPVDFRRPEIIPAPQRLDYRADTAVRLDNATSFIVECPADGARTLAAEKLRHFFDIDAPAVSVRPDAGAAARLGAEGYALAAKGGEIIFSANALQGLRHALSTLRQAAERESAGLAVRTYCVPELAVQDKPALRFRALHLCWFPEQSTTFIERAIRLAGYYKFNFVVLECWGTFRSARHPFLSLPGARLDAAEAHRLAAVAADCGITLVPQVNILGHASLSRVASGKHVTLDLDKSRQPLFEPYNGWNWCLSNPDAAEVVCDFVDEVHEAFGRPAYFHVGCDEGDPPTCARCRAARPYAKLIGTHIARVATRLREHGARILVWHDMLLKKGDSRWEGFYANGDEDAETLLDALPQDAIICDWHYGAPHTAYPTLDHFASRGFDVLTCPFFDEDGIAAQGAYAQRKGLLGLMETSWAEASGQKFARRIEAAACAAWGEQREKTGRRQGGLLFYTHWRQCGWDMGVNDFAEAGVERDQMSWR